MDTGGSPTQSSNSNDAFPKATADAPALDDQTECPSLASGSGQVAPPYVEQPPTTHALFSTFLSKIHVVDMLQERSTVCTFDASIPIYEMICAIIAITSTTIPKVEPEKGEACEKQMLYPVSADLASNILAEICHFSDDLRCSNVAEGIDADKNIDTEDAQHRSYSSAGWGSAVPVEGETMGWLQMPLTVTELAEFLFYSDSMGARSCSESTDGSILDWGLARWRKFKEDGSSFYGCGAVRHGSLLTELPSPSNAHDPSPLGTLVQRAAGAPPRPMLRIDEPESTFLRAVELLLAHPELNALPIVSMSQRTVVAHLTLAECLALLVQHFRGKAVASLGDLTLPEVEQYFVQWKEIKSSFAGEIQESQCVVMHADQDSLLDLLDFFAQTNFTAVPVVTDGNLLVGVLGRRNFLQFLGLCMESCVLARRTTEEAAEEEEKQPSNEKSASSVVAPEEVFFDTALTLREVMSTLESYLHSDEKPQFFGTGTTTELSPLKTLMCNILLSDNHKLVRVETGENGAVLRRLIHVNEVIKLILGRNAARMELTVVEDV